MGGVLSVDPTADGPAEQPQVACVACRQMIRAGAGVCRYCRAAQSASKIRAVGDGFKWIAGAVTVISLVGAVQGLWDVYGEWRHTRVALEENLVAAELLRHDGNFAEAWAMQDMALELSPASLDIRRRQADLAMQWLRETETPEAMTFAALADKTEPVLYRGLVGADAGRSADILAHIALGTYLRGLETREHGNEGRLLEQALASDADNVHANALMGFWIVYDGDDKAEAMAAASAHFERALAHADGPEFVREWQLMALRNALDRRAEVEAAEKIALGRRVLVVADAMRKEGSPAPTGRTAQMILDVHGGTRRQGEHVDSLLDALEPDRYLATLAWLTEGEDLSRRPQTRYVIARLHERSGNQADAAAIYSSLAEQPDGHSNKDFNVRVDEALQRLTGEPTARAVDRGKRKYLNDPMPEDADPWEFHAETLLNFDPVWRGRNLSAALEFFEPYERSSPARQRSNEALALLDDARDRVRAYLDPREREWAEHGFQLINDRANAKIARANLRDVWWTLASISMVAGDWERAIAELDDLTRRAEDEAPGVRYDLACSYSRRSETYADTAIGEARRTADQRLALASLDAAVKGWNSGGDEVDWAHIKQDRDLDAVRDTQRYQALVAGR